MKYEAVFKLIFALPIYQKLAITVSAVSLVILIYGVASLFSGGDISELASELPSASPDLGHVTVNVTGAVAQPGIYSLMTGDRVAQAIEVAGGLSSEADQSQINQSFNLAEPLTDGEKLEVPSVPLIGEGEPVAASPVSNLISLNHATLEQLDSLPGIGPSRAQAIIEQRPYTTIEEVVSKGVLGQSVWEQIKDKVSY